MTMNPLAHKPAVAGSRCLDQLRLKMMKEMRITMESSNKSIIKERKVRKRRSERECK